MRIVVLGSLIGWLVGGCASSGDGAGGQESEAEAEAEAEAESEAEAEAEGEECKKSGSCEFTAECCDGYVCDGTCRLEESCDTFEDCSSTEICGTSGLCVDGDNCEDNFDCDDGWACFGTRCVPEDECDNADPSLSGDWNVEGVLEFSSLPIPSSLTTFFETIALADTFCLPGSTDIFCELVDQISNFPDDITLLGVEQTLDLSATSAVNYATEETWTFVTMTIGDTVVEGDPDMLGWDVVAADYVSSTNCGTLTQAQHNVTLDYCDMFLTAINGIIGDVSGGEWEGIGDAVTAFCGEDLVCEVALSALVSELACMKTGESLTITYGGTATITSASAWSDGQWNGSLSSGASVDGEFTAAGL